VRHTCEHLIETGFADDSVAAFVVDHPSEPGRLVAPFPTRHMIIVVIVWVR
jgi:hypothetical protein